MLFNRKISRSHYTDFIKCTVVCAIVLLTVSLIGALAASLTESPVSYVGIAAFVSLIVSAAVCGVLSAKMMKGEIKIPIFSALFITLVLMIIGLIVNRGAVPKSAAMNYVCYLAVFSFVSLLSRGLGKKRSKKFRHKY